jgi:hypothetical protein
MKIVFQAPQVLTEIASEPFVAVAARTGSVFFKPLSAPGIYEDRIDLTIKSAHTTKRAYPYKRADESVN